MSDEGLAERTREAAAIAAKGGEAAARAIRAKRLSVAVRNVVTVTVRPKEDE